MKDTYLDVKARDEQGKDYIIEMQVLNVAGFEKRGRKRGSNRSGCALPTAFSISSTMMR